MKNYNFSNTILSSISLNYIYESWIWSLIVENEAGRLSDEMMDRRKRAVSAQLDCLLKNVEAKKVSTAAFLYSLQSDLPKYSELLAEFTPVIISKIGQIMEAQDNLAKIQSALADLYSGKCPVTCVDSSSMEDPSETKAEPLTKSHQARCSARELKIAMDLASEILSGVITSKEDIKNLYGLDVDSDKGLFQHLNNLTRQRVGMLEAACSMAISAANGEKPSIERVMESFRLDYNYAARLRNHLLKYLH